MKCGHLANQDTFGCPKGVCNGEVPLYMYILNAFSPTHYRSTTIRDLSWENARIVLVGNKSDLTDSRVVNKESADDLAQQLGIKYIETSAKDDVNVKLTFETLVDEISEKMAETMETNPNFIPQGVRPRNAEAEKPANSGCGC